MAFISPINQNLYARSSGRACKSNLYKNLKEYIQGYPKRINYTYKHRIAYRKVEKELLGKNTLGGYLHDLDKLVMYVIGVPKKLAHSIHVATAPHHMHKGHIKRPVSAVIDWECARLTKPDKPLSAREFYEKKMPKMPEIDEALKKLGL